ncbi:hypothetical protein N9H39_04375 [Gammaproteobacteria bacterium]|nr:hypothetical protein [Gammaproteobacteria bacterium]
MKPIKAFVFVLASAALAVVLSSCGGGGSSSGAGSKAATPFSGQYAGVENLSLSGPGGSFPIGILPISIAIDADGGVVVTDSDSIPYIGQLGDPASQLLGNQFIATAYISIPTPSGILCMPATYGYIGNVVGDNITGNASGTFMCTGQGRTAALVLGGPFSAIRGVAGVPPGSTSPAIQTPGNGSLRKSHKQKIILDGMESVF